MSGERSPGPDDGGRSERSATGAPDRPDSAVEWIRWALVTDQPTVEFLREVVVSVLGVLLVGLLLFAASGIWPPMVAVESGSMEPHMYRGDLVFVMEEHRLSPEFATGTTGVVTYRAAAERDAYRKFGEYGDVIVFSADGGRTTPVIHRARFWVDDGENWAARADPAYVSAADCGPLPNCPAPHAGFITKGDNNDRYDQVAGISGPVRPAWIKGTAEFRIPWLGYVRLSFSEISPGPIDVGGTIDGSIDAPGGGVTGGVGPTVSARGAEDGPPTERGGSIATDRAGGIDTNTAA